MEAAQKTSKVGKKAAKEVDQRWYIAGAAVAGVLGGVALSYLRSREEAKPAPWRQRMAQFEAFRQAQTAQFQQMQTALMALHEAHGAQARTAALEVSQKRWQKQFESRVQAIQREVTSLRRSMLPPAPASPAPMSDDFAERYSDILELLEDDEEEAA